MITKPMKHQTTALAWMKGRAYYGLFMEQGTGKTWCLLADAERLYKEGEIEALLVVAPNGVHTNWVRREIPQHLSTAHIARAWKSGMSDRQFRHVDQLFKSKVNGMRILAMNIESLATVRGIEFVRAFLTKYRTMLVVDESTRIKNPAALRTKMVMQIRPLARIARIATGTPATNAPVDVFSQMEFLCPGLLETHSYRAFVAEYAELVPPTHPMRQHMIARNPKTAYAQMIARDEFGRPKWRNLAKLQRLLEPHTYRVRKDECLDLPPKVYQRRYFDLSAAQHKAYRLMKKELRMVVGDEIVTVQALAAGNKLQQITSGFVLKDGEAHYVDENNPRLSAFMDIVEDLEGQFIVYACFREEVAALATALQKAGISAVTYNGDTTQALREEAVDNFQHGTVRAFVGSQKAAGIGLTLTAASTAIYYSNSFNLEHRLQSEDRCHRKGTTRSVLYIDLVAEGTIDEIIAEALASKSNMAAAIVGDLRTENKTQ